MISKLLCFVVLYLFYDGTCQGVGERCYHYGASGVCAPIDNCQSTFPDLRVSGNIKICGFLGQRYIICCLDPVLKVTTFNTIGARPNSFNTTSPGYIKSSYTNPSYTNPSYTNPNYNRPSYTSHSYVRNSTTAPSYIRPIYIRTSTTAPSYNRTSTTRPSTTTTSKATTTTVRPVATTPRLGSSTTEYIPPVYDYVITGPLDDGCAELDPKLTAAKTGRKAWDKCIEYQQLVFPCERSVALLGNRVRANHCAHAENSTNEIARPGEFPHMVVLAVRGSKKLRWMCSGTLISDRFIISSAWCWDKGSVTEQPYAILGTLERMTGNQAAYQEHRIERIIRHPRFRSQVKYHNIALLKTETVIQLNQWTIPACLDVTGGYHSKALATRWRARSWNETNRLQKIFLHKLSKRECQQRFSSIRNLKMGFKAVSQICYEAYNSSNDTCKDEGEQGSHMLHDNDGFLTIENDKVHCMYTIIGVTSLGRTCGAAPASAYTKVSNYVTWIESIVWPDDNTNL